MCAEGSLIETLAGAGIELRCEAETVAVVDGLTDAISGVQILAEHRTQGK
jgi:hypothetical protein